MYSAVSLWVMISVVLIFTFVMISFPLVQTKRISIFILSVNPPPVLFCISDTGIPTPHYNASVLSDMFYEQHLHYLYDCLVDFPGMKDAVALLKVWLHQRQFDQVCFIKVHTYCQGGNPYNKLPCWQSRFKLCQRSQERGRRPSFFPTYLGKMEGTLLAG